jgi:REP element-mobilizing transposase RayT
MRRFPRTPPRLDRVIPNNPVFFVTFCTYRRKPLLATDVVNQTLIDFAARAYADHNIAVGRYVIMPDHIHLLFCGPDNFELGGWVGMLKQCVEKQIVRDTSGEPLWQRRFFDHVLRSEESYAQSGTTCATIRCGPVL